MRCFSKCVPKTFVEALAVTGRALERHGFAVLGQIDVGRALDGHAPAHFGPYVVLSACCPELAKNALSADDEIGPMLLTDIVVRQRRGAGVEITAIDPMTTIGTLNHVVMTETANDLHGRLQAAFDEIDAECRPVPSRQGVQRQVVPAT